MADPKVRVPANLIPVVQQVSDYYGMPFYVLAAVIQEGTGWTNNVDPDFIVSVGQRMASNAGLSSRTRSGGSDAGMDTPTDWLDVAANTFSTSAPSAYRTRIGKLVQENITSSDDFSDADRWTYDKPNPDPTGTYRTPAMGAIPSRKVTISSGEAGAVTQGDAYNLFHERTGRYPTEAEVSRYVGMTSTVADRLISSLPEAASWRQNGPAITGARRWADSVSMKYTGQPLSNEQLQTVVANGWNPQQLETYLGSQKYGDSSVTLGQAVDLRDAMDSSFRKVLGRPPTEGEIQFAISKSIPSTDTDALAEQTRDHTQWATDPTTYTTARSALRQVMGQAGIVVADKDISADIVNKAASQHWTVDQMKQYVGQGQMPGAPGGTTVDKYTTTKNLAQNVWGTYFPNETLPTTYINQFLGMTPDQISLFVRALPSPDAKANGQVIPVGTYNDARAAAQRALTSLGVVGREPTSAEIGAFASSKFDVESITKHYATDPAVLATNPGTQYGKSREDYSTERADVEGAYNSRFGGVDATTLAQDKAKAANPTPGAANAEPDWLQQVFKQGYNAEQASAMFDTYFRNTGAAPSADDISMFKTRAKTLYSDQSASPAAGTTNGQPTLSGLDDQRNAKRSYA